MQMTNNNHLFNKVFKVSNDPKPMPATPENQKAMHYHLLKNKQMLKKHFKKENQGQDYEINN